MDRNYPVNAVETVVTCNLDFHLNYIFNQFSPVLT